MIATPALSPLLANYRRYWGLLIVLVAILFIAGVRIRVMHSPLERDEGEYAYAGQLILQGIPPYQLAYNMKFPGTYAAYALIMSVFGQTPAGIHLGVLCVTSLTGLLLYWLGRRLIDEWGGAAAGAAYVFLAASPGMYGLCGHATQFAALFGTAGACFLWPRGRSQKLGCVLGSGLMFGLAILMKQQAFPLALWGMAMLLFGFPKGTVAWSQKITLLAVFCLGLILPFCLTCLILWQAGVFGEFWFWTIAYAREYVSLLPLKFARVLLKHGFDDISLTCRSILVAAVIGLVVIWLVPRLRGVRVPLLGFFVASFLTTCPGFYFRNHYFLLMIPALALLAGCTVSALQQLPLARSWHHHCRGIWPALACCLMLGGCLFNNLGIWFRLTPYEVTRRLYFSNPFPESEPVAEYIQAHSIPSDQIAVLGSEPQIYFLSRRHSATSYIYMYALMEPQPFAHRMQQEMIAQLERARPKFIVFATINYSWLQRPNSDATVLSWWHKAYETNYVLTGVAEVVSNKSSRYQWENVPPDYESPYDSSLMVYQRKDTLAAP